MIRFELKDSSEPIWIPEDSDVLKNQRWVEEKFPLNYRYNMYIVTADNVLTPAVITPLLPSRPLPSPFSLFFLHSLLLSFVSFTLPLFSPLPSCLYSPVSPMPLCLLIFHSLLYLLSTLPLLLPFLSLSSLLPYIIDSISYSSPSFLLL